MGPGHLVGPWRPPVQLVSSLPQEPLCEHALPTSLHPSGTGCSILALHGDYFRSFVGLTLI